MNIWNMNFYDSSDDEDNDSGLLFKWLFDYLTFKILLKISIIDEENEKDYFFKKVKKIQKIEENEIKNLIDVREK